MTNDFLNSLSQLNQFLDKQSTVQYARRKELLSSNVASTIADMFINLPQDATKEDINNRALLSTQLAAKTNTLQSNMPIIAALQEDKTKAYDAKRANIEDAMQYSYLAKQYGDLGIAPGVGSGKLLANAIQLQNASTHWEKEAETIDGQATGRVFETQYIAGKRTETRTLVDATTFEDDRRQYEAKEAIAHKFKEQELAKSFGYSLALARERDNLKGDDSYKELRTKGFIYKQSMGESRAELEGQAGVVVGQLVALGVDNGGIPSNEVYDANGKKAVDDVTYIQQLQKSGRLGELLKKIEKKKPDVFVQISQQLDAMSEEEDRFKFFHGEANKSTEKAAMYDEFGLSKKDIEYGYDLIKGILKDKNSPSYADMMKYVSSAYKAKTSKDYNKQNLSPEDFDNLNELTGKGYFYSYIKERNKN